jgi:8-oxo-dGTP diphosphatase
MSVSTPNTEADALLRVAVGLLMDGNKVFITRRAPGSHQGGKWEFPGGKIEPGENTFSALRRELREEVGIDLIAAQPYLMVRHVYYDRDVLLDVWRVTEYQGIPQGQERQEAKWIHCHDLAGYEFPDADQAILERITLPSLYLITDSKQFGSDAFLSRLELALIAGARLVQLREPQLSSRDYKAMARETAEMCHRHGAKLLINAQPDWVSECGADGVHLNSRRLRAGQNRPLGGDYWVAASCHDIDELTQAAQLGVDFVVLGPVAPTTSHPQAQPLGWKSFSQLCASAKLPVYALGGMRAQDLWQARQAGAVGLAMISGIWRADSIEQTVALLASN